MNFSSTPPSKPLSIELISACQLTSELEREWKRLRQTHSVYQSPCFDIEFTRAVSLVRDDVEVALLRDSADLVGIFPFQRIADKYGQPVGGRLNDLHGILGYPIPPSSYEQLLSVAHLKSFAFHAIADSRQGVSQYEFDQHPSFYVDLEDGWEPYFDWVQKHSSTVRRHRQKSRALKRDTSELQFEFDCQEPEVLEQLISRKRARYQSTKTFDILSVEWAANLLRIIHRTRKPGFQGLLSVIRDGDEFVAAHFGMVSGSVLHYWFPVYSPRYRKYSPGTELFLNVTQAAADAGITKIDFGFGGHPFKSRFCNGREVVSCGEIQTSRAGLEWARFRYRFANRMKHVPMKSAMKSILRMVYPRFGSWNFR